MKKINFTYNRQKDIWCLLNKGKSSNNSQSATKVYQELVSRYGDTLKGTPFTIQQVKLRIPQLKRGTAQLLKCKVGLRLKKMKMGA